MYATRPQSIRNAFISSYVFDGPRSFVFCRCLLSMTVTIYWTQIGLNSKFCTTPVIKQDFFEDWDRKQDFLLGPRLRLKLFFFNLSSRRLDYRTTLHYDNLANQELRGMESNQTQQPDVSIACTCFAWSCVNRKSASHESIAAAAADSLGVNVASVEHLHVLHTRD